MPLASFFTKVRAASALAIVCSLSCGELTPGPENFAGAYLPSVWLVTPAGQPQMDVLLKGGSLSITITSTKTTTGQLSLPASVTGTTPLLQSMSGEAVVTGSTLKFSQPADTFVRDLTWTVKRDTLEVVNQVVNGTTFTIKMPKH